MMLTRRQKAQLDRVATLIGEDVVLKDGALYAQNTLRIDGQYRGEINSQGAVIIGTSGIVERQHPVRTSSFPAGLAATSRPPIRSTSGTPALYPAISHALPS